ncbi:MAG: hypothetical protein M3O77_01990 [Chloroflexota bacterium]|nr:hypothetical protein [Chloroflexota bacterium]
MNDARRERLERLTRRWRSRHDAARPAERPPADAEREEHARSLFPYRELPPADYADRYGGAMTGFTYDDYTYQDPELEGWLVELGRILRTRRTRG